MSKPATTCFRVLIQRSNGLWTYLFDADFDSAVTQVREFKARGIKARFEGEQTGQTRKAVKPRTNHRAVR